MSQDNWNLPIKLQFVIQKLNSEKFTVVPEGSHELKAKYLDEKHHYIGKQLTVEFYERTDYPKRLPFHCVGIGVRDYE